MKLEMLKKCIGENNGIMLLPLEGGDAGGYATMMTVLLRTQAVRRAMSPDNQ
jgi:hypothetical protein